MKLNETDATLRRIGPLYAVSGGVAVEGEDFGGAGELEISVAGGAFAAALGTIVEIGDGFYYYQATALDAATAPWVVLKISGVCDEFTIREDVTSGRQAAIQTAEPLAALRRVGPFRVLDADGDPITTTVGITTEISVNGAAWAAAAGALTLIDDGYVYYVADTTEVAAAGWIALKLTGTAQQFVMREDIGDDSGLSAPTVTVVSTFPTTFSEARVTPWEAEVEDFPLGAEMVIIVRYTTTDQASGGVRNETITARDASGTWRWPFDIEPTNAVDLEADPVTVQLLPRGGWPPCEVNIQIAAAAEAVEE